MDKATLSLFNAIQISKKNKANNILLPQTIKYGFILSPEVAGVVDDKLLKTIIDTVGISGDKVNASFHKSWKIIEDSSHFELVMQQIMHYITTYGFEELGIYNKDYVYIPAETLNIPKIKDGIKLVVIKGLTKLEIKEKILELASGIALKPTTLEDIMTIIQTNKYGSLIINEIKNKELKSKLYDYYDLVPSEPIDFLRFTIQKLTSDSLLIKSPAMIAKIKSSKSPLATKTLDKLVSKAPSNLAEIFFRYKPIFLALKSVSNDKTFFNKLRKDAIKMHIPMKSDYLNEVTAKLSNGKSVTLKKLNEELEKVNVFRKIRLASALKFRTSQHDSIVYRIRNGKGYATDFSFNKFDKAEDALEIVLKSIIKNLNVKGKTIYIPDYINYALPATEKMFTGNFPTGSYITVPENMIVGIHWFNHHDGGYDGRVDLDLSTVSASGKTGWDSNYRSEGKKVLFSGDITDAPRPLGASELFLIKEGANDDKIMYCNYFNYNKDKAVEAKIIVASATPKSFEKNYMVNPNDILAVAPINITEKENVLGLITNVDGEHRFYFAQVSIGNNISASYNEHSTRAREFFAESMTNSINFNDILELAGATIVNEKPEDDEEFIDLSPESLDKTTIINLINGK